MTEAVSVQQKWCYCWPPHPVVPQVNIEIQETDGPLLAVLIGEPDDNCPICQAIKGGQRPLKAIADGVEAGNPNARLMFAESTMEVPCR